MSVAVPVVSTAPGAIIGAPEHMHAGNVWRAPLVPVALAFTTGILLDRHLSLSLVGSLFASGILLAAALITSVGRKSGLSLIYLALALVGFGAAHHRYRHDHYGSDDIGWLASDTAQIVEVR